MTNDSTLTTRQKIAWAVGIFVYVAVLAGIMYACIKAYGSDNLEHGASSGERAYADFKGFLGGLVIDLVIVMFTVGLSNVL